MELYYIIAVVATILIGAVGYWIGSYGKKTFKDEKAAKDLELTQKMAEITTLTADRDVQKSRADNMEKLISSQKLDYEDKIDEMKKEFETQKKNLSDTFDERRKEIESNYNERYTVLEGTFKAQLAREEEAHKKQIDALKEMNKTQMDGIKDQMRTTSEEVLKERQKELGEKNQDVLSTILEPLKQNFKEMAEAFERNKTQQHDALTRLDQTIKTNMEKSKAIGESADRLSRALTGEVKIQGNFGELKLKQLLEDLELKEGEQFFTQEHLKDITGKEVKGDDGKGAIPDFILRFPNERYVVVDSKMSLTDFERYMNAEDGSDEKQIALQAHLASVKAQVKRLAKKDYSSLLPKGYNRLTFAIMYIPIEGALNLAILNDKTLWQDAYEQGVMILGPQTMYMNLRVLEMMWTQVRQLENQEAMIKAANLIIERVQDFGKRYMEVENSMNATVKKMSDLRTTTADSGQSIITAARNLIKAGGKEKVGKKSLNEISTFLDSDNQLMLPSDNRAPDGSMFSPEANDIPATTAETKDNDES